LLGKTTSDSISQKDDSNNNKEEKNESESVEEEKKEDKYFIISDTLEIKIDDIVFNNFKYDNNNLSFNVTNNSSEETNNYFIETYSENKTLVQRLKINLNNLNNNSLSLKASYFYYLIVVKKNVEDYPIVSLGINNTITCTKDNDKLEYVFVDSKLSKVKHTIINYNTKDTNYNDDLNNYQILIDKYNNMSGVTAVMNSSSSGFIAMMEINLGLVNISEISNDYYFKYNELPKVVKFEMESFGFSCKTS
jgi:hypothetical protein